MEKVAVEHAEDSRLPHCFWLEGGELRGREGEMR